MLCIIYYTFYIVVNREGRGDIYPGQRGTLTTDEGVGGVNTQHSAQQSMTGGEQWAWGELSEYEWQIPAVPLMGGRGTLSTGEPSEYDTGIATCTCIMQLDVTTANTVRGVLYLPYILKTQTRVY